MATLKEELATYDKDQQKGWLKLSERGEGGENIRMKLSNAFRGRFRRIVQKYNEAPIYRIPFPANEHN